MTAKEASDIEVISLVLVFSMTFLAAFCCILLRKCIDLKDKLDVHERWLKKIDSSVLLIGLRLPPHKLGDAIPPPPAPPASRVIKEGHAPPMPPEREVHILDTSQRNNNY